MHRLISSLYERRVGGPRDPTVIANVKAAQVRQLRSAEAAGGLCIRLLGPMAIVQDGKPVVLAAKKARALVGYLSLREGSEVSRSVLTGLLWGERSEEQARGSLRQTLSELRTSFANSVPQPIIATKEAVCWVTGSAWVDAKALEAAAASEDDEALRHAAAIIGGELMEGLSVGEPSFEHWLSAERARFRLLAETVYTRLMERVEQGGRAEEALAYGLKLLSLDPLQEHVHRALMRIYAAQGRHDAALVQYERCRTELSSQIGVKPDADTEALVKSIRASRREGATKTQARPSPAPEPDVPVLPAKPSIAVLPFVNMSGDPEQEYFSEGITEDIITELGRFRSLFVISRSSSSTYKGRAANVQTVGRDLGVHYVVEGSIRRSGSRIRVTAQLIDAESGSQLWAERYDRDLADIFSVQDEVTQNIVANLAGYVDDAAGERAFRKNRESLSKYDLLLRGKYLLNRSSKGNILRAREIYQQVLELDPQNAPAHVGLASTYVEEAVSGWAEAPDAAAMRALDLARTAVELDDRDSQAHLLLARAYLLARSNFDLAASQIEKAITLNPNEYYNYCFKSWLLTCSGDLTGGIVCASEAMRRNPLVPDGCLYVIGFADYLQGRYEEALSAFGKISSSRFLEVGAAMAACYAGLSRHDDARLLAEEFLKRAKLELAEYPAQNLETWRAYWARRMPFKDAAQLEHLLSDLRKIGLPG